MKKTKASIVAIVVVSVFLLSFLIGRATALRDREAEVRKNEIYTGTILIPKDKEPLAPAGAEAKNVPMAETVTEKNNPETAELQEKNEELPPERMFFPCGQAVLNGYSQTAVYSKTMDDWRAHMGIDYVAEVGSEVKSVWDGTVKKVYKDKLWGHTIEILHAGGLYSVYRNLDKDIMVKEGQKVIKGQAIGKVSKSAAVEKREEPHLHFELWTGGEAINPESYIY